MTNKSSSHIVWLIAAIFTFLLALYYIFSGFNYYAAKKQAWFNWLPQSTVLAINLDTKDFTSHLGPVSSLKQYFAEAKTDAPDELANFVSNLESKKLIYLLYYNPKKPQQLAQAISIRNANQQHLPEIPPGYQSQQHLGYTWIYPSQTPLDFSSQLALNKLDYQKANHPGPSKAYLAMVPENFSRFLFQDELLTATQKSIQNFLRNYDNLYFNIESKDQRLFLSNYNFDSKPAMSLSPAVNLGFLVNQNHTSQMLYSLSNLQSVTPKLLEGFVDSWVARLDLNPELIQQLMASQLTLSLDTNNQLHIYFHSPQLVNKQALTKMLQKIQAYFDPKESQQTLSTDQQASYTAANPDSNESSNITQFSLKSLAYNLLWPNPLDSKQLHFILTAHSQQALSQQQPQQFEALSPKLQALAQDYAQFSPEFLAKLFGPNFPHLKLEIATYNFIGGQQTLITVD
jgi:hypothetical protein